MIGYTLYGIYSTIGYFTDIKGAGTVLLPDLIFVYHAIPVVIFQVGQCFYYPVIDLSYLEGKQYSFYAGQNIRGSFGVSCALLVSVHFGISYFIKGFSCDRMDLVLESR